MIGDKIKKARKKAGITQQELAKKLGTTPQNLSQYEKGKRQPKKETLEKIADALDVNVWDLYDDYELPLFDDNQEIEFSNSFLHRQLQLKIKLLNQYKKALEHVETELGYLNAEKSDLNHRISILSDEISELKEALPKSAESQEPTTIAAHFDGDKYTDDEMDEIKQFTESVKSKRKDQE